MQQNINLTEKKIALPDLKGKTALGTKYLH